MNALYNSGKSALLRGRWADETLAFKAAVVDRTGYTFNATHDFLNDIAAYIVGTPVALLNREVDDTGFATADDIVFNPITGKLGALVIYQDTGTASTSPLLAYIEVTNWPVQTSAAEITINWSDDGIITLG